MPLCIAQCMTVGAPQIGKSSLKRRLLKQINQPNKSTGVADRPDVVSVVTVDGSEWTVLGWEEEGAQFLLGIDQQPSNEETKSDDTSSFPETTKGSHLSLELPPTKEPEQETARSVSVNTDPSIPHQNDLQSYSRLISTILDVGSEKWKAAKKCLENQCTIYFTDTGGQLEFQEVLPAIISGPSIFLLVFNLEHAAKGLDKEFPAVYKRSDGSLYEPPPGISTFTTRNSILHILASIQGTRPYHFQEGEESRVIEPKVLLVGTHSDCVTDPRVRSQIERDVQNLLKDTQYYRKGMLHVPCRKPPDERFVYMVNNESSEDPVFQEIREKVRSIIFKEPGDSDYKEDISAYWLGFDLCLRWPDKPENLILTYQQCVVIGSRCGIKESDVKRALMFLHRRFGIIRYFQGEGLGDKIITNPQVINDAISDLIAEKFHYKNPRLTPEQVEDFQNKGLISEDAIKKCIAAQTNETATLDLPFLLSLLSHLHVIVKLEGDEDDPETKYFIPCVLVGAKHDLSTSAENSEPRIADLLILFDRGRQLCPKGLFSVLAIKLYKQSVARYEWQLNRKKLGREQVVFFVHVKVTPSRMCTCTVYIQHGLIGSRSVLRIFLEKVGERSCLHDSKILASVCKEIHNSVKSGIKSSLDELQNSTKFRVGFYSTCDMNQTSSKNHIAIVNDKGTGVVSESMICIDCDDQVCFLREGQQMWLTEVRTEEHFTFCFACSERYGNNDYNYQFRYPKNHIQDQKVFCMSEIWKWLSL